MCFPCRAEEVVASGGHGGGYGRPTDLTSVPQPPVARSASLYAASYETNYG